MIQENQPASATGRYLLYAIGEITLVVIGILIALSINDWNDNRKRQNEEISLLLDVKKNLESMLSDFESDTIYNAHSIVLYEKIEYYISNDLPYSIELDSIFGTLTFWRSPYITATAYNSLQSKGLDLIKNEALKNDIIEVYEVKIKKLTLDYDDSENDLQRRIVEPFLVKHVKKLHNQSLRLARPNDFESLKENNEFSNIMSYIIRQRKRGVEIYAEVMNDIESLIEKIDHEVEMRKTKG